MKQLNIVFEDSEHKELEEVKEESGLSWHDFILLMIKARPIKKKK